MDIDGIVIWITNESKRLRSLLFVCSGETIFAIRFPAFSYNVQINFLLLPKAQSLLMRIIICKSRCTSPSCIASPFPV